MNTIAATAANIILEEDRRERRADRLKTLRETLGPDALKPKPKRKFISLAEKAAWSRLRNWRRDALYYQATVRDLLYTANVGPAEEAAHDAWAEAQSCLNDIRRIRYVERRAEGMR